MEKGWGLGTREDVSQRLLDGCGLAKVGIPAVLRTK